MPKEQGGRLFIHRQVTMKVCHQLKLLIMKIILEDLVN